jgi:hypothetical protein
MAETLLVVDTDYTVHLNGRRLALASPVRMEQHDSPFGYGLRLKVSFDCTELPDWTLPAPKPKRTWANAMGLRKPRGS